LEVWFDDIAPNFLTYYLARNQLGTPRGAKTLLRGLNFLTQ